MPVFIALRPRNDSTIALGEERCIEVECGRMRIREFGPSDYEPFRAIHDSLFPAHPFFRERVEYEDSCFGRTRYRMKRFVAESEDGRVVAVGGFNHLFFSYHPLKFALSILVHPDWHRQGVGGMLYVHLLSELRATGAETAWARVPSDSDASESFVTERGFRPKATWLESTLDLTSLDLGRLGPLTERLKREGITMSDLATEMSTDAEAGKRLFELENSADEDVPNIVEAEPMNYHDYEIVILRSPLMVWQGSFVAKRGDEYVGSSCVLRSGRNDMLDQGFTAVRPELRGKGIAQAVKLNVAKHAKNTGTTILMTQNDSRNASMLAVNRKLGFVKRYEWITFEKELSEG